MKVVDFYYQKVVLYLSHWLTVTYNPPSCNDLTPQGWKALSIQQTPLLSLFSYFVSMFKIEPGQNKIIKSLCIILKWHLMHKHYHKHLLFTFTTHKTWLTFSLFYFSNRIYSINYYLRKFYDIDKQKWTPLEISHPLTKYKQKWTNIT